MSNSDDDVTHSSDVPKSDSSHLKEQEQKSDKKNEQEEGKRTEKENAFARISLGPQSVRIEIKSDKDNNTHAVVTTLPLPEAIQKMARQRLKRDYLKNEDELRMLWIIICVGFSLAMIVIGSIYLYDCKLEPKIPIFLIVYGVMCILDSLMTWIKYASKDFEGRLKCRSCCKLLGVLMDISLIAWFILGCVWVYGIHSKVQFKGTHENHCNRTLYMFAFWFLNLVFILLLIGPLLACAAVVAMCDTQNSPRNFL